MAAYYPTNPKPTWFKIVLPRAQDKSNSATPVESPESPKVLAVTENDRDVQILLGKRKRIEDEESRLWLQSLAQSQAASRKHSEKAQETKVEQEAQETKAAAEALEMDTSDDRPAPSSKPKQDASENRDISESSNSNPVKASPASHPKQTVTFTLPAFDPKILSEKLELSPLEQVLKNEVIPALKGVAIKEISYFCYKNIQRIHKLRKDFLENVVNSNGVNNLLHQISDISLNQTRICTHDKVNKYQSVLFDERSNSFSEMGIEKIRKISSETVSSLLLSAGKTETDYDFHVNLDLAFCYLLGCGGLKQDASKGIKLLQNFARHNFPIVKYILGIIHKELAIKDTRRVTEHHTIAYHYFLGALNANFTPAYRALGTCFQQNIGLPDELDLNDTDSKQRRVRFSIAVTLFACAYKRGDMILQKWKLLSDHFHPVNSLKGQSSQEQSSKPQPRPLMLNGFRQTVENAGKSSPQQQPQPQASDSTEEDAAKPPKKRKVGD